MLECHSFSFSFITTVIEKVTFRRSVADLWTLTLTVYLHIFSQCNNVSLTYVMADHIFIF